MSARSYRVPGAVVGADIAIHVVLAVLVLALGLSRLATGPWYLVYGPQGGSLLGRWPVAWEVAYYLAHVPTFLSSATPSIGIAAVHERTLTNLFLGSVLYGWTENVFWAFAAVDLALWFLAGVATLYLARRLGGDGSTAVVSAVLCVASPILVSNMWRHDFHTANFATMPIGLWAAVTAIDERPSWRYLALVLGGLLVLLAFSYQYQWIMIPLIAVLLAHRGRLRLHDRGAALVGAIAVFLAGTALIRATLSVAGLGPTEAYGNVVSQPGPLLAARLAALSGPGSFVALLPNAGHLLETVRVYHPLVVAAAVVGAVLASPRVRWLTLVASALSLVSLTLYAAPWTAMSAYPLVYWCAARACTAWRHPAARAAGIALAAVLVAVTNLDLVGDTRFVTTFWTYFAEPAFF